MTVLNEQIDLKNKSVLIAGLGRSGVAAFDALVSAGAAPAVYDDRDIRIEAPALFEKLALCGANAYLGGEPVPDAAWDLLVLSPGVPPYLPFIQNAALRGAEIIGELELSYRLGGGRYAAITGTNGKTTTTSLVGEMFTNAGLKTVVAGNIGTAVTAKAVSADADTWLVTEASSFQLETTARFRPKIAALLNLTPDHMDRHQTMENYAAAKGKIFANQEADDVLVYNANDALVSALTETARAKKIPFSRTRTLPFGAFARDGKIVFCDSRGDEIIVAGTEEVRIPGAHNLENALAAVCVAFAAGVAPAVIAETLRTFKGVAHRLELAGTVDGVRFINDSKGTNPDAAIKAIESVKKDIILIAGGYDKDADFTEFVRAAKGRVTTFLLLGETAKKIKACAEAEGFADVRVVADMDEAVRVGFAAARAGGAVLLSPACASWDMYRDFEQRGDHFKAAVNELRGRYEQSSGQN